MKLQKIKPCNGQLSFFGELPVKYCPVCGRRLHSPRSHRAGVGPRCRKHQHEARRNDAINKVFSRMISKARKAHKYV